jgi:formylglycine-generating enzyme required for sulfatase activity
MILISLIVYGCDTPRPPEDAGPMAQITQTDGHIFYIDRFEFPNQPGTIPTAEMDLSTAQSSCASVGKRLCTLEEWKTACGQSKFPYGEQYEHNRCHSNQQNSDGHTSLMHGRTKQVASGTHRECHGDAQIYDMVGNLEEWVSDDFKGMSGNLAGGAWYTYWQYADCTVQYSHEPDYRLAMDRPTDSAGVRCCWSSSPPPRTDAHTPEIVQVDYDASNEIEISEGIWMDRFEFPNQANQVPMTNVDWQQASELCKQNGKNLCSTQIWEYACNNGIASSQAAPRNHSECNIGNNNVIESSTSSKCQTKDGVVNLIGNVWEWTRDEMTVPEFQVDRSIPWKEIRGGSFFSDSMKAQCTPLLGYPLSPSNLKVNSLGFRCCREESTLPQSNPTAIQDAIGCPPNMIATHFGCIDQYEYPNQINTLPTSNVNLSTATMMCQQQGKHLCSNEEWYSACAGSEQRRWSYGNQFDSEICAHGNANRQGGARPSGQYHNCKTPEGAFDLTGNLWEWTSDGHLRGGNWNFSEGLGQCHSIATPSAHTKNDEVGFRCCASVTEVQSMLQLRTHDTP